MSPTSYRAAPPRKDSLSTLPTRVKQTQCGVRSPASAEELLHPVNCWGVNISEGSSEFQLELQRGPVAVVAQRRQERCHWRGLHRIEGELEPELAAKPGGPAEGC